MLAETKTSKDRNNSHEALKPLQPEQAAARAAREECSCPSPYLGPASAIPRSREELGRGTDVEWLARVAGQEFSHGLGCRFNGACSAQGKGLAICSL